jgi:hypothetical protein
MIIIEKNAEQEQVAMATIKEIKQTVSGLASEEPSTLYAWYEEYNAQ